MNPIRKNANVPSSSARSFFVSMARYPPCSPDAAGSAAHPSLAARRRPPSGAGPGLGPASADRAFPGSAV